MKQITHGNLVAAVLESANREGKIFVKASIECIRFGKDVRIKSIKRKANINSDGKVTVKHNGKQHEIKIRSQQDYTLDSGKVVTLSWFEFA